MATTYSNPKLNERRTVEVLSAVKALDVSDSGKVFILDAAAGATVTLPALVAGFNAKFVTGAAFATTNWVIASNEGDNINGVIIDMGGTPVAIPAVGEDQINFVATAEAIGDYVEFIADADNSQWIVSGVCATNGGLTATDPA